MKRVMDVLWPIVGLGAVAFTFRLLARELHGLSLAKLGAAFAAISPLHWLLALGSTGLAYTALAWYDQIALAHLGRRLNWRFVGLVSFTTYALAHNIGATMLSGAVIRYRAYSTKGLGMAEVGVLVAFCSFTFTLGNLSLAGLTLLSDPELVRRYVDLPDWAGRLLAIALLGAPCLYTIGSLLHFAPLHIRGLALVYPRPPTSSISRCRRAEIPVFSRFSSCSSPRSRWRSLATPPEASGFSNIPSSRRCRIRRPPTSWRRFSSSGCCTSSCRCCSRSSSSLSSSAPGSAN